MPEEDWRSQSFRLGLVIFKMCECEEPQIDDGNAASREELQTHGSNAASREEPQIHGSNAARELAWLNLTLRARAGDWSFERQFAELAELLEAGALTEQEFEILKTRLIDGV